jgi:fumarate hydratase subunit beta
MSEIYLNSSELAQKAHSLRAGDRVFLSGTVYTARDAAHKRFFEALDKGETLPFSLYGAAIYYAGPTPTPDGRAIGSCGPTTSSRMDTYSPRLLNLGLKCMIGKGERNAEVCDAICKNSAVYLCAVGGAGALASMCITKCDVIAYDDLGCESVKKLEFDNFPLICAIDSVGGNLFK